MTQTQPTDPNAPLTNQQILAAIAAAGSTGSTTIGLGVGQKPVGVVTDPTTGGGHPGMSFVPGPESQFGTETNKNPYQEGDQLNPGTGTQAQIAEMQGQLVQAGLLAPTDVRAGFWDAKSSDAYKVVLAFANQHAMNAQDALAQFLANPVAGAGLPRYPLSLDNPETIQADFASTAAGMTGGGIPASESQAFSNYQSGLEEQGRERYVSAKTDKNAAYVAAPTSSASARSYILAHNPQDVVNYDLALRTIQFQNALKEL